MDSARRTLLCTVTLFGLHLIFANGQALADQASCEQIRTACKNAGFVLGGGPRDGLLLAFFNPIVERTPRPRAASLPLPAVNAQVVNACRAGNDASPAPAKA